MLILKLLARRQFLEPIHQSANPIHVQRLTLQIVIGQ